MNGFHGLPLLLAGATALLITSLLFYGLHRRLQRQRRQHIQLNIQQLALLRALISGFQRHRGLSNGVLCGDASLSQDLAVARQGLDRHNHAAGELDSTHRDAWHSLIDHWSRMREGRSSDPANNLAQHHLIIRNSIFLMEDVASEIDLSEGRAELSYLPCIWREVVQAAEWAGQARALGTGIAAAGQSSAEQRVRMRFLYQKIELLAGTAFATLQRHATEHPQAKGMRLEHGEQVVADFLRCIQQELLGQERPVIAAKTYFQRATQAIDELLALVDTALAQLQPAKEMHMLNTVQSLRYDHQPPAYPPVQGLPSKPVATTRYRNLSLTSHFQPIFSIAHGRAVGYEGLIRAQHADGTAESPATLLAMPSNGRESLELDRTCRTLHVHNFAQQATGQAWLFLNLNSQYLVSEQPNIGFTRNLLQASGIAAHRLVIEIIESEVSDQAQLKRFISHFRQLGCLIAIDDFGAGHSNFDRIWDLEPDIVKIDRRLIQDAGQSRRVERILTGIVSLLHEAGSLVVVEGVESEHEALVAIAANADMIQGFYFARPQARIDAEQGFATTFDNLLRGQQWQSVKRSADLQHYVREFKGLFHQAVAHFAANPQFEQSCGFLFRDPRTVRCYLLNEAGYQMSRNVYSPHYQLQMNARFAPLLCGDNANWSHKHYHYRALKQPGVMQISRPYLSVADSRMCITLSQTIKVGGTLYVFCCDLDWQEQ